MLLIYVEQVWHELILFELKEFLVMDPIPRNHMIMTDLSTTKDESS